MPPQNSSGALAPWSNQDLIPAGLEPSKLNLDTSKYIISRRQVYLWAIVHQKRANTTGTIYFWPINSVMARGVDFFLGFRVYLFLRKTGPGVPVFGYCLPKKRLSRGDGGGKKKHENQLKNERAKIMSTWRTVQIQRDLDNLLMDRSRCRSSR